MAEDGVEITTQGTGAVDVQEAVAETDKVLEKFHSGNLLVHVVPLPGIVRGDEGFELDLTTWKSKLEYLGSDNGMPNTSTTLIMEGTSIELYVNPTGFIFDATQVEVENVALRDSGSGHNPTDLHTIDDLKDYYKAKTGSHEYNEVLVNARGDNVLGLVIRKGVKAASTLAGFEAVRSYLRTQDLNFPVYEYDEREGSMKKYQGPNRSELLEGLSPTMRPIYEKTI